MHRMHAIPSRVFTIGHSTHPFSVLADLLKHHAVALVVDVRSAPYSRWTPQFNREALDRSLDEIGIRYAFFGDRLGARSPNPAAYEGGRVDYERLGRTSAFRAGLSDLSARVPEGRIALICAEADPLQCHRTILIGRELKFLGMQVEHILQDGGLVSQEACEAQLLEAHRLVNRDLFADETEILARAYRMQAGKIAYVRESVPDVESDGGGDDT